MGKKLLKGKLFLLGASLLLLGAGKAESTETTKLDETFAHFLDEQKNLTTQEVKKEMDVANIVSSEELNVKKNEVAPVDQKVVSAEATKNLENQTAPVIDVGYKKKEESKKKEEMKKEEQKKKEEHNKQKKSTSSSKK
jgi:hypothetical protein